MQELGRISLPDQREPFVVFLLRPDNILLMQWSGYVKGESIMEAHESVLPLLNKHQIRGIVEDVVNFNGPFQDVNEWFVTYWVPAALKVGLKKAAVLISSNVFTQFSVEDLKENPEFRKLGLGYRIFDSLPEAAKWISA